MGSLTVDNSPRRLERTEGVGGGRRLISFSRRYIGTLALASTRWPV